MLPVCSFNNVWGEKLSGIHLPTHTLFSQGPGSKDKPCSHKCIYEWIKSPVSQHLYLQMAIYPREMSSKVRAASVTQTHSVAVSGRINQLNFSHSGTCAILVQKWKLSDFGGCQTLFWFVYRVIKCRKMSNPRIVSLFVICAYFLCIVHKYK